MLILGKTVFSRLHHDYRSYLNDDKCNDVLVQYEVNATNASGEAKQFTIAFQNIGKEACQFGYEGDESEKLKEFLGDDYSRLTEALSQDAIYNEWQERLAIERYDTLEDEDEKEGFLHY